jgi:hypothetical protein
MKELTKLIFIAVIPALLIMPSCSMEKRVHRKGYHITVSIFKNNKKFIKQEVRSEKKEIRRGEEEVAENLGFSETNDQVFAEVSSSLHPSTSTAQASNIEKTLNVTRSQKKSALKSDVETKSQKPNQKITAFKKSSDKDATERVKMSAQRKTAIVTGASLLLMAVLAGISMPALGTVMASVGLIGIFILDLLVAIGVVKYHKKEKPRLAKVSGFLRML